jgi:pimeloyl-ACP methyl ester carboxylesterase
MLVPVGLGVIGWVLALQAVGLRFRLPGVLLLPRRTPRAFWGPLAVAAVASLALGVLRAPAPPVAVAALVLGLLAAVPLALGLASLVPLRPDEAFLPAGESEPGWAARPLQVPGQSDARAVLLVPRLSESGICIIVSHGGGNDRIYGLWHALPLLLGRGHWILLSHMAGHGEGGSDVFDLASARARIDGLVRAARAVCPEHRLVLLGQSMGAAVSLDAAARGLPLAAVVALSAPAVLRIGASVMRELGAFLRPPLYRALRYGTAAEVLPAVGPFRRRRFPVRVAPGRNYVGEFTRSLVEMDLPNRLRVANDTLPPILLVHGAADGIVPAAQSAILKDSLGARADLQLLPATHHLEPMFETRVVQGIADWLEQNATRKLHPEQPIP